MRIALIGSHCVGKSTLMDPLCDRLDIHRIDEIVREWCKDNGYASVADVPNKNLMQWTILIEQVVREKMLTEHFGSYISDRSTVDNAAYFLEIPGRYLEQDYLRIAREHTQIYDALFLIPASDHIGVSDDSFRHIDRAFQQKIQQNVYDLLHKWQLWGKTHVILSKTVEDRVNEIVGICENGFRSTTGPRFKMC